MHKNLQKLLAIVSIAVIPSIVNAAPIYLNNQNISVSLGSSMAPNPFANRSTIDSLASIIDASTASTSEFHNQSTHVWVSNGTLELVFDLQKEYDLTTMHFWNYHSEGFDVDNIDFKFYDNTNNLVGSLLNVAPALGGSASSDSTPIFAQDYILSFPSEVRYINAVLSGSNGQVDFNNIGFTGSISPVPEPTMVLLLLAGLGLIGGITLQQRV